MQIARFLAGPMRSRISLCVTCVALAALGSMLLWIVARPLSTGDLWFHLKAGELYLNEGLWPAHDPMLFTGLATGPVQHEWLFGVMVHALDMLAGWQGLRVAHVLWVMGILALGYHLLRRASGSAVYAAVGCGLFVALASQRLVQLRPDLVSIPATWLLYLWLIAPSDPRKPAIVASAALTMFWANAHSLVSVGLGFVFVALVASVLEWAIARYTLDVPAAHCQAAARRARTLASAWPLMCLAGLLNPRGHHQLLTFFESSGNTAVLEIADEWTPFSLFTLPTGARLVSWLLTDAVVFGFLVTALIKLRALRRERSYQRLRELDPVGFLVSAAACGAVFVSVRFMWLSSLPLLYCARALAPWAAQRCAQVVCALTSLTLCLVYPTNNGFLPELADAPRTLSSYLTTPINRRLFADESVQFLRDVTATGRIFNPYGLGAYLGYRLAPQLRTFIDSRTEHYPQEVFDEWRAITAAGQLPDGRGYLQLLAERDVDFFLATGLPGFPYDVPYTLAHLERTPGWMLVFRNAGQAIYLRATERNQENAQRIARYYRERAVPYDAQRGFDVGNVLRERLDWAVQHGLVPGRIVAAQRSALAGDARASLDLADMLYTAGAFKNAAQQATHALQDPQTHDRALSIAISALRRAGDQLAAEQLLARARQL